MAETTEVIVRFRVQDGDIDEFASKITSLNGKIDKTASMATSSGKSIKGAFDGSKQAAENFQGGLGGVAQQFKVVGNAAKVGGAAMKSALISTGIGALVVALGLIVDNWEAISAAIFGTNDQLQRNIEYQSQIIGSLEHELKLIEIKEKQLKVEGLSTVEVLADRKRITEELLKENEIRLENLKVQLKQEESAAVELSLIEKIRLGLGDKSVITNIISDEEKKRIEDTKQQIQDTETAIARLKLSTAELNNPETPKTPKAKGREKVTALDGSVLSAEEQQLLMEKEAENFAEIFDLKKQQQDALKESAKNAVTEITKNEDIQEAERLVNAKKYAEARARIAAIEAQQKEQALSSFADSAMKASELIGKETAVGKGLAVASTLISTYQAAQQAYQSQAAIPVVGPYLGGIAAAVAVASGLANVKAILAVKTPSAGGAGGAGGNAVTAPQAPSFNVVGNSPVNQLADTLNQEQNPVQAYVVSGAVTSQQELDRNIQNVATIG